MASKRKTGTPNPNTAFGKRVLHAMKMRGSPGFPIEEAELVRRIQALAPGDEYERLRTKSLTQQMVNHVLNGQAERSYFMPFIAAALGVSALWLGWGIGHPEAEHVVTHEQEQETTASASRGRRASGAKS